MSEDLCAAGVKAAIATTPAGDDIDRRCHSNVTHAAGSPAPPEWMPQMIGKSIAETEALIQRETARLKNLLAGQNEQDLRDKKRVSESGLCGFLLPVSGRPISRVLIDLRKQGLPGPAWVEERRGGRSVVRTYDVAEVFAWANKLEGWPILEVPPGQLRDLRRQAERNIVRVPPAVEDFQQEIINLRKELDRLWDYVGWKNLLTEGEILSLARPARPMCGIYFLIRAGRIVYVGKSANIHARSAAHFTAGEKVFDSVASIEIPEHHLDLYERSYIKYLKPEYNIAGVPPSEGEE